MLWKSQERCGRGGNRKNARDTSSLAIRMSSVTLENTVGSMKKPFLPSPLPPHSSLAPSATPLWMSSRILLYCFLSICRRNHLMTLRGPSMKTETCTFSWTSLCMIFFPKCHCIESNHMKLILSTKFWMMKKMEIFFFFLWLHLTDRGIQITLMTA